MEKSKKKRLTKKEICSDTTKGHVYFSHAEWLRINFGQQAYDEYVAKMDASKK